MGGGEGVVGGLLVVSPCGGGEPISTNRLCQLRNGTWVSVVVLKYRSMSGVKYQLGDVNNGGGGRGVWGGGLQDLNDVHISPACPPADLGA